MPSKVIDVEDADFSTLTARDTLNVAHPFLRLVISIGIRPIYVFQWIALETGKGRPSLVYRDVVLFEDRV